MKTKKHLQAENRKKRHAKLSLNKPDPAPELPGKG
jgi:hypothetical protein